MLWLFLEGDGDSNLPTLGHEVNGLLGERVGWRPAGCGLSVGVALNGAIIELNTCPHSDYLYGITLNNDK